MSEGDDYARCLSDYQSARRVADDVRAEWDKYLATTPGFDSTPIPEGIREVFERLEEAEKVESEAVTALFACLQSRRPDQSGVART